ncbi:MAG: alpha/beta hydrolase [Alphaproteobacteria bacterium]|nr:MAG: alpha/beta hydrolase [Alphaproteobacteria bacterium]
MANNDHFVEKYYLSHDGLKLYYRDYNAGSSHKTPLLCLHGLTRNSKDFDRFATHFSHDRRVISLDIRGRGQSEYDPDYKNYQIPTYVQDVLAFLAHEKLNQVTAVGTSMGGLISMAIGAMNSGIFPSIFKGIILNDIGPEIDPKGIERISGFVGNGHVLQNWQQAISGMKALNGWLFPDYSDAEWDMFARNSFREQDDGTIVADYDPAIGKAMKETAEATIALDLWPLFAAISPIPVLTLRGENSDILSSETLLKMAETHPAFTALTVRGRAHTPDLFEDISLKAIDKFINSL